MAREATPAHARGGIAGVGGCLAASAAEAPEPRRTPSAAVGSGARKSGGDAIRWRRAASRASARASRARARRHPNPPPRRGVCTLQTIGYDGGWRSRDSPRRRARGSTREKRRERRESPRPGARAGGDASLAVHARASSGARGLAHQPSARRTRDISTLNRFVGASARVPPFSPPGRNAPTPTTRGAARRWTLRRWTMTTGLVSFPPLSLARTRRGPSSDARYTSRRAAVGLGGVVRGNEMMSVA